MRYPASQLRPALQLACAHRRVNTAWMVRVLSIEVMPIGFQGDPGATATGDGGGLVTAAPRPIEGGEQVARYLADLNARAP